MVAARVLVVAFAFVAVGLAGCISGEEDVTRGDEPVRVRGNLTTLEEREVLPFDTTGDYSVTLEQGPHEVLKVLDQFITVDIPPTEGLAAAAGTAQVHMGVWLPSNIEKGAKVPVIADIGPYYGDGDNPATEPAGRLGGFLIQNFVPHGYAVAQVSVFGTGESNHCMDLMGDSEQAGIDAAVSWLGTQDWSNGNVGLIGRSYDGSTPWEAATFGNPHLKTIAPISGLIGLHELMWRNGSAELRGGTGLLWGLYFTFGANYPVENALCPDAATGMPQSLGAYATGDHFASAANPYWVERYFLDRALANYEGSVYFIHGLQDWNVDPHMAFPTHHLLEQRGFEVKGLYGQWAHMYPDRPTEHENLNSGRGGEAFPQSVRYDWAQDLLEWFDHYLMETGPKPALHAEVQDNMGNWRVEETYPPRDAKWTPFVLGEELAADGETVIVPGGEDVVFTSGPLAEETRIAGLGKLHVDVTPTGPGGQVYALLEQVVDGEALHLGHAIMDLRFHQGGKESTTVVAGETIKALMEFEAFDVVVPEGATLRLTLSNTGEDYMPSAVSDPVMVETGPGSELILPVVERAPDVFFSPPAWDASGFE